eukprot:CAMPEP_0195565484 /NCGR_PEP_ID=MMETSP0814-20130614/495_1 /TAXON_ID=97485 /ORGANISM="Prymnesium parvum, Strain Texoma1" /LENGTH=49 /DNA_ID= /DNA_START= /DNA_END= /DNA_ORIENTATION=
MKVTASLMCAMGLPASLVPSQVEQGSCGAKTAQQEQHTLLATENSTTAN